MSRQTFHPMPELVDAVKAYAAEHYEDGGWDVIVECYTDEMIENVLRGKDASGEVKFEGRSRVRSPKAAIKRVGADVGVIASVRSDIEATAF